MRMAETVSQPAGKPADKLSTKDYRIYNGMAEHMDYFVFFLKCPISR